MKNYFKELIILFVQLFMFYIFPLFAGPTDAMGMVILILLSTLILSLILGIISNIKVKYLYPIVLAISFVPTVFIYYNKSALIHCVWYFVISFCGLLLGNIVKFIISKLKNVNF